jgi:hypothetical protein
MLYAGIGRRFASQAALKLACDFARNAHGRNVMIILGRNMDTPVKFVAYLKKDSELKVLDGGTGVALRIAEYYNIPTICLNDGTHNNITIPSIINNLTRPW